MLTPSQAKRQQVVFVGRVLWGGGAERVTFDLAHSLNRSRFEPHVVHLFDLPECPIRYDPAIPVHPVEPVTRMLLAELLPPPPPERPQPGWVQAGLRYYRLLDPSLRGRLALGARLRGAYHRWKSLRATLAARRRPQPPAPPSATTTPSPIQREMSRLLGPLADLWPQTLGLKRVLNRFDPDAILVPIMEEAAVRVWLTQVFTRRRYIASLHSVESFNLPLIYPDRERLADEEWLFSNACRSAEVVTVPSTGCRDDLSNHYGVPPANVRVMVNPVACDWIRQHARAPLPEPPAAGKTLFVQVARLDYDKNPDLLIDAADLLRRDMDDFVVLMLGKGSRRAELEAKIQARGLEAHVRLLGEVTNPYPFMAAARALVLTSRVESFALVLLEAMLCGAVPISVDCPFGPREVLEGDRYGLLVRPDDPEALAQAMLRIARDEDLYQTLRARGPERASRYDLAGVVREWEALLDEVCAARPPRPIASAAAPPA